MYALLSTLFIANLFDLDIDLSTITGKLDGIAQKVDENLFDLGWITFEFFTDERIEIVVQVDIFFSGTGTIGFYSTVKLFFGIKNDTFNLHLAALKFGEVKNIVDNTQKIFRTLIDNREKFMLLIIEFGCFKQFCKPDNAIERCSDLM